MPKFHLSSAKVKHRTKLLLGIFVALTITAALWDKMQLELKPYTSAQAQSAEEIIKSEAQIREEMISISEQLGLTCLDCHNTNNFTSDEKKNFKVAQEHIKITQILKDRGFDGKRGPEASCYMCHQGQLRPNYQMPKEAKK